MTVLLLLLLLHLIWDHGGDAVGWRRTDVDLLLSRQLMNHYSEIHCMSMTLTALIKGDP